ncbi:DUF262 domain-containing protein [Streptacidiphilus jiangxiensis]|uniref:GmrSD restriction endonucleases N-terminal domain-containing protein n=1 Tax=Streptacidiphilus jiangxiensis TaxID=235985 RepID=A0A1H7W128_STRJI|nr:DUF262 domain-containing protein [Streptacidiphilus jiangxiensis]SEM14707.1 Protein of unknown function DUF262 [Streptacidiphilus jiangxiensis]
MGNDDNETLDLEFSEERDIEEQELELDSEFEQDPIGFWEAKQRDLLTSVLDYNLKSLTDLVRSRSIDLSPSYQRRNRWDETRKSQLIESFLMNVPIPNIFLNEDAYGHYSVIDGKQRLTAISDFLLGRYRLQGLSVFPEANGLTFDELPSTLQTILETRANLRAVIILRQSDPDIKYQVFQRLNTGGIRLNPQEIRNSAWPGKLNDMILEESISREFHVLLGIKDKSRSAIYKEMRDAEFVLRYLTFRSNWDTFAGGMGRKLDSFMGENHAMKEEEVEEQRKAFREAISKAHAAFGPNAFQRWSPEKGTWRRQVLASLYDAEIFALSDFSKEDLAKNQKEIIEGVKKLFQEPSFRRVVDAATNTPTYFRERIQHMRNMISDVIG